MLNNANTGADTMNSCTCGNFGCQKRLARGLVPFCQMAPAKSEPKRGFSSYRDAAAAHPGCRIVLVEGGYNSGAADRFDAA